MGRARQSRMRGAWTWLVWAALLMLVAQPATAAAFAGPARGETIVVEICSSHAGKPVKIELPGDPAPKGDCQKCDHGCCPPAALNVVAPLGACAPAAYVAATAFAVTAPERLSLARAPPRPPSQGPPASDA
ncbi:MAG: hypothetical protein JWO33_2733 [Caulobacteraceae bacterium]|nr:hypothetical protein [Caulobacteraceae bacterium]